MSQPDMTREQAAELKQLRKALTKTERDINSEERRLRRAIANADSALAYERAAIQRRAAKEIKAFGSQMLAEQKPLCTQLARILDGRAPSFKVRALIARRIAILEGRLSS